MTERLLRIVAPPTGKHAGFVAGLIVRDEGPRGWRWVRAAPIVRWMTHQSVDNIGRWLKGPARKAGWRYSWHR